MYWCPARDRKIIEVDNQISKKKQRRFLKQVHKNIINDRKKLDNATNGDRQQLRNTLQEHKSLQLAYQNLYALVMIPNAHKFFNLPAIYF